MRLLFNGTWEFSEFLLDENAMYDSQAPVISANKWISTRDNYVGFNGTYASDPIIGTPEDRRPLPRAKIRFQTGE